VLVLATATVAACTPPPESNNGIASAGGGSSASAPTPSRDPRDVQRKWAQCMREHGIDVPDPDPVEGKFLEFPTPKKGTAEEERFAEAEEACKEWDPGSLGGKPHPERVEQQRKVAQCMRDRGFDVPDPDPSSGAPPLPKRDVLRQQGFQQAMAECTATAFGQGAGK